MPSVEKGESQEHYMSRCIPYVMNEHSGMKSDQAAAVCHSLFSKHQEHKEGRFTLSGFALKEDGKTWTGIVASTHPDRVGDILSRKSLDQIANAINNESAAGTQHGSFRSISLFHDWVRENDPTLDEAGFFIPGTAKVVPLDDGKQFGVQADFIVNPHYRGEMTSKEIEDRIKMGGIAGLSIEYQTDDSHSRKVSHSGQEFRFIEELTEFGGAGFARPRMIANPAAVIYKEIEASAEGMKVANDVESKESHSEKMKKEESEHSEMPHEVIEQIVKDHEKKKNYGKHEEEEKDEKKKKHEGEHESEKEEEEEEKDDKKEESESKKKQISEHKELLQAKELAVKEAVESIKEAVKAELETMKVKSKVAIQSKEDGNMAAEALSVKEMNAALASKDIFAYKEAASHYFAEHKEIEAQFKNNGIPLNTTLSVKCDGTKLRIVDQFEVKDTLDTTTNTSTYTQNIVEFADVFLPGIVESFNQQINLFSQLKKVPHLEGGNKYGWRITTDQQTDLAIDPDDVVINKVSVKKLKLQTDMKEYRAGVSVSDYTLFHSRASIGDLFMVEVEKRMKDLLHNINRDLFSGQVDSTGNKILGLKGVADTATYTTLYGLTRSAANRLAPDAAADTYLAVGGALTEAVLRAGIRKVEVEGAQRGDLRIVTSPAQRDALFGLMAARQYIVTPNPAGQFGFANSPFGQVVYDGIPIIYDTQCPTSDLYVIDEAVAYIVMSRPPQLIGLAKIGAAEEAFISTYLAFVYELPRRIYNAATLS